MEPWHHHRRPSPAETWFLPFNFPTPQPELAYTHSVAEPVLTSHSQARLDNIYSTADTSLPIPPSFALQPPISPNTPSNGPQFQSSYPRTGADHSESHDHTRNQFTAPQSGESPQEFQEVQAHPRHNVAEWNSRYADIKKFYKDEKGDLEATRKKMLDLGFDAS